jgi:hypothetical protein
MRVEYWPSRRPFRLFLLSVFLPAAYGQQAPAENAPGSASPPESESKRIFWIIPNYRTYPTLAEYKPITPKQKFRIAVQDSFDRGTVALAAAFAGEGQITHATPEFGQGVAGYARYFATSYADLVIGDFLTEAVYPTVLHQDPRYFRRGTGSGLSRLGYAVGQIFWTHRDAGGFQFNYSEIGGNATAVALSNAYYPGSHDVSTAASKFGLQIGVDMASNILKEFWPDLNRKFAHKHAAPAPVAPEGDHRSPPP